MDQQQIQQVLSIIQKQVQQTLEHTLEQVQHLRYIIQVLI